MNTKMILLIFIMMNDIEGTNLSISARMSGRLAAMSVLEPNFLPNGRSHTTASTLALGRGRAAHTEKYAQDRHDVNKYITACKMFTFNTRCHNRHYWTIFCCSLKRTLI